MTALTTRPRRPKCCAPADGWRCSATTGVATQLPQAVLDEVLKDLGAAIDAVGGSFTARYTAVMVTAVRLAA